MSQIVLKTEDLGISFGGLKAVQNVNLEIKKKQLYGLVGPNGAGKTTLLSLLSGLAKPTDGKILYEGKDISKIDKNFNQIFTSCVILSSYIFMSWRTF